MINLYSKYFFILLILPVLLHITFYSEISFSLLCENRKEPVICENICEENEINLVANTLLQKMVNLFSSKTFLRGRYKNELVFLKSLGIKEDFKKLEKKFDLTFRSLDNPSEHISLIKLKILELIIPDYNKSLPKLTLCSFRNGIEALLMKMPDYREFSVKDYSYIWTLFQINPEPFLLKILKPPTWPTPKYFGICGHVFIVEDCGTSLINYYNSPWLQRANYTLQVLEGALKFTFQDPDFVFYLTDISPDNIVINSAGVVKFIDLENVILMDRKYIKSEKSNHSTVHFDCVDCFIFDPQEICTHAISDHNIYSVCKEILSDSSLIPNGFLHSYPSHLQKIKVLIEECISPKFKDRFEIAREIINFIQIASELK